MTDYEQEYRDLRAGVEALADEWETTADRLSPGMVSAGVRYNHAQRLRTLLASSTPATASEGATTEIEDGFGGYWTTCGTGCDLQVVRPGKVQRNRRSRFCPDLTATGVTSSDGDRVTESSLNVTEGVSDITTAPMSHNGSISDMAGSRGLSEEERGELVNILQWHFAAHGEQPGNGYDSVGVDNALMAVERILAARTVQPDGVERVEWGVRVVTDRRTWEVGGEPEQRARAEVVRLRSHLASWRGPNGFYNGQRFVGAALLRRTVTTYAPIVGPWERVEEDDRD